MKKHYILILVIIVIAFAAFAGKSFLSKRFVANQATSSASLESENSGYIKRHFIQDGEFFQGQKYPKELTGISDNNLVEIDCPEGYVKQSGGGFTLASNPKVSLNDEKLKEIMNVVDKDLAFSSFNFCNLKDGRIIFEYEYWLGGGGKDTIAKFAVVDANSKVNHIADINNSDKIPYFVCDIPLEMTVGNQLYWACRGGDGGFGASSIYKIDLNNNQVKTILSCTSRVTGSKPSVICK